MKHLTAQLLTIYILNHQLFLLVSLHDLFNLPYLLLVKNYYNFQKNAFPQNKIKSPLSHFYLNFYYVMW